MSTAPLHQDLSYLLHETALSQHIIPQNYTFTHFNPTIGSKSYTVKDSALEIIENGGIYRYALLFLLFKMLEHY